MDTRKRTNTPRRKLRFWKSLIRGVREDGRTLLLVGVSPYCGNTEDQIDNLGQDECAVYI
jgi:hypothetical protein